SAPNGYPRSVNESARRKNNSHRQPNSVMKSTVQQIRERFDKDVERFSRLEIGNTAQVDSVLSLELIACAAAVTNPNARSVLDVGCGAGNYVLKILEKLPNLNV